MFENTTKSGLRFEASWVDCWYLFGCFGYDSGKAQGLERQLVFAFLGVCLALLMTPGTFGKSHREIVVADKMGSGFAGQTILSPEKSNGLFAIFPSFQTDKAERLAQMINNYRRENGLQPVPYSPYLTYVAQYHVYDLEVNSPVGGACNLHSWSNRGKWTPCCYTRDHAQAECMWNKPNELTEGSYTGTGYEIAVMSSGGITASEALDAWKGSKGHNDVILNRETWSDNRFRAMGVAVSNYYAVVWFGEEVDPLS